jgi:2-methylcitrate synthase
MSGQADPLLSKVKKSVALSGTVAGNTAICTVGRNGNDLHYRGYNILDFAETAEFEEIAYLLIYGQLPTKDQLLRYKAGFHHGPCTSTHTWSYFV